MFEIKPSAYVNIFFGMCLFTGMTSPAIGRRDVYEG